MPFGEFKIQPLRPDRKKELLDAAVAKIGTAETNAIEMDSFRELYGDETVESDLEYVRGRESEFHEDETEYSREIEKLGKIFEAIINQKLPAWLGERVKVSRASRYDDIRNGVDSVVEVEEDLSTHYLALAIDATFGNHTQRKISKIKREIESGKLTMIKYFASQDGTFRGRLSRVPRVVIAADKRTLLELIDLWVSDRHEALADHPIQQQILEEIRLQLDGFRQYAEKMGQPELARIYAKQLAIFKKIAGSQGQPGRAPDRSFEQNDLSFRSLRQEIANL